MEPLAHGTAAEVPKEQLKLLSLSGIIPQTKVNKNNTIHLKHEAALYIEGVGNYNGNQIRLIKIQIDQIDRTKHKDFTLLSLTW